MTNKEVMYRLDFKWHKDKECSTALYPSWEKANKDAILLSNSGNEVSEIQPVYVIPKDDTDDYIHHNLERVPLQ